MANTDEFNKCKEMYEKMEKTADEWRRKLEEASSRFDCANVKTTYEETLNKVAKGILMEKGYKFDKDFLEYESSYSDVKYKHKFKLVLADIGNDKKELRVRHYRRHYKEELRFIGSNHNEKMIKTVLDCLGPDFTKLVGDLKVADTERNNPKTKKFDLNIPYMKADNTIVVSPGAVTFELRSSYYGSHTKDFRIKYEDLRNKYFGNRVDKLMFLDEDAQKAHIKLCEEMYKVKKDLIQQAKDQQQPIIAKVEEYGLGRYLVLASL